MSVEAILHALPKRESGDLPKFSNDTVFVGDESMAFSFSLSSKIPVVNLGATQMHTIKDIFTKIRQLDHALSDDTVSDFAHDDAQLAKTILSFSPTEIGRLQGHPIYPYLLSAHAYLSQTQADTNQVF